MGTARWTDARGEIACAGCGQKAPAGARILKLRRSTDQAVALLCKGCGQAFIDGKLTIQFPKAAEPKPTLAVDFSLLEKLLAAGTWAEDIAAAKGEAK